MPVKTTRKINAFDLINRPLSVTEARDINAFSDYSGSGFTGSASSADLPTIKAMQDKMKQFGWGKISSGSEQLNTSALNQEMNPQDLVKAGEQSGKSFSLVAPTMIAEGLKRARLMGINSKAAFLENADIIFKGVRDDVRNNQFFKNVAPDFYKVAANIYEDRLRNFVPSSPRNVPAQQTQNTPTAP